MLRGSAGLQSCCCWSRGCAVSNGCDISQQLLLTPLHCCRWGVWLTRHIVSAPVCTQWTLTLHALAINTRKMHYSPPTTPPTLMLPLRQPAHPDFLHDHLNIQKLQTTADAQRAQTNCLHPRCHQLCLFSVCGSNVNSIISNSRM